MADVDGMSSINPQVEGLRERKRKAMREHISNTATAMFMERGFNEVKVSEVADACNVSEKTIYNYFANKESLLLDRYEESEQQIRVALGPGATKPPVEAILEMLFEDLRQIHESWVEHPEYGVEMFRRFRRMINETPSLLAASRNMADGISDLACSLMAERAGLAPDDPEPKIAAAALSGLWTLVWDSIEKHSETTDNPDELVALVTDDLKRAARLLDSGLWLFSAMVQSGSNRAQIETASIAARRAGNQVITALKQAHKARRALEQEHNEERRAKRRQKRTR